MKIVYMGTPAFACPPLEHLYNSDHKIQVVVTVPDQPTGRGKKVTPAPACNQAESLGLEVLKPNSLKDDSLFDSLRTFQPDLIVVVAFRILSERIIRLPKYGAINVHASLLPKYRGAAPINWALINGEKETGLTSFFLKKTVDTGDIILQEKITIDEEENYDSLYTRLSNMTGPFLLKTIELIQLGKTAGTVQDDSKASAAPKISPFDAMIDFGFPADKVRNFVRGLSTKPGAYTFFRGKKLKIYSCRTADRHGAPGLRPGTIITAKKALTVQCANSAVELTCVVPEGKKQMDGGSFLNGFKPQEGEILGEIPGEDK